MKPRWPQRSRVSCLLVGESISKTSAATKGTAWTSTTVVDKSHLVNTGRKGGKYCQRDKTKRLLPKPSPLPYQTKKNSGG